MGETAAVDRKRRLKFVSLSWSVWGSQEHWRPRSSFLGSCCVRGGRLVSVSAAAHDHAWSGTPVQTRWGFYWTCGRWCLSRCRPDDRGTTGMSGTFKNTENTESVGKRVSRIVRTVKSAAYLLIILRWTILRMMILSAQSFRKSDIFCFSWGFISCLAMTFRWSHEALQRRSIWQRFSCSWSKSTWKAKKEIKGSHRTALHIFVPPFDSFQDIAPLQTA